MAIDERIHGYETTTTGAAPQGGSGRRPRKPGFAVSKSNPFTDRVLRVAWLRGFAVGHQWADDHRPGTLAARYPAPLAEAARATRDLTTIPGSPVAAAWTRGVSAGKAHFTRHGFDTAAYRYADERGEGRSLAARPPNPSRPCAVCGRPISGRSDRRTCGDACRKALSRAEVEPEADMAPIGADIATAESQAGVTHRPSQGVRSTSAETHATEARR